MQEFDPIDGPEQELAEALAGLQLPPMPILPRDLWYRAGFEAGRKRSRAWQGVAAAAALAAAIAVGWAEYGGPAREQRIVYVHQEGAAAVSPTTASDHTVSSNGQTAPTFYSDYARLRDAVAMSGLDALPREPIANDTRQPASRERRSEESLDAGSADDAYPFYERG